jgi:hypothetical protein
MALKFLAACYRYTFVQHTLNYHVWRGKCAATPHRQVFKEGANMRIRLVVETDIDGWSDEALADLAIFIETVDLLNE